MSTIRTPRDFRCPRPDCGRVFERPGAAPGALIACPACARPMNARPSSMEAELRAREAAFGNEPGGEGLAATAAGVERLPFAVLVDNLRSMWNVGSIFRTADACGVERLVLAGITGTPPQRSIVKVSLGAEDAVRWEYRAEALAALQDLRADGYTPVALETGEGAEPLEAFEWPVRPCLVVGHEVRGISPEVFDAIDLHVAIPMGGVKSSFNVAVAFGIAAQRASVRLAERLR